MRRLEIAGVPTDSSIFRGLQKRWRIRLGRYRPLPEQRTSIGLLFGAIPDQRRVWLNADSVGSRYARE